MEATAINLTQKKKKKHTLGNKEIYMSTFKRFKKETPPIYNSPTTVTVTTHNP